LKPKIKIISLINGNEVKLFSQNRNVMLFYGERNSKIYLSFIFPNPK